MIRSLATFCLTFALAAAAGAAELRGKVVAVADGETLTVLDAGQRRHSVKLAGVDAPEKDAPLGERARQHLAKWLQGEDVIVTWRKRDLRGRLVGVVIAFGHDMGLEQIRAGLARWAREEAPEQEPEDQKQYELAEHEARAAKRGLWSEPHHAAPPGPQPAP